MKDKQSLDSFFNRVDDTTLDNCDREKLHLSNAIQPIGALIAIQPENYRVIAASDNADHFLGLKPGTLIDSVLSDLNSELCSQLHQLPVEDILWHEVLEFELCFEGVTYNAVTHLHAGIRFIEFLPNNTPTAVVARKALRRCTRSCAQILNSATFDEALQIATDAIAEFTGFSRVRIYKFLPDWSGEVVAERKESSMPSYLGLHFPESDIPRQVRSIMSIVPYRAIGTSSDGVIPIRYSNNFRQPLDLSWSLLRSVSTMHTQYLRNMGVNASFSCSLMSKNALWGLIAAHNDTPMLVPFDNWGLIHELGTTLMLRYDQHQKTELTGMIAHLRRIENDFSSTLRKNGDIADVISELVPTLQTLLGADGFAFQYGTKIHVSGATPPPDFIRHLIEWTIEERDLSFQYQTTQLQAEWPAAKAHIDTACGVLIQPLIVNRVCHLVWFRGPMTQKVHWAGKPTNKNIGGDSNTMLNLHPRNSFDRWTIEHSDQSASWKESEIESAQEIFKEFLNIIAAQMLLKEENVSLRDFAAIAAHDIKAPLRRIYGALDIMSEENFKEDVVKETHAMAMASAIQLQSLTTSLFELNAISEQKNPHVEVDLNHILLHVKDLIHTEYSDVQPKIIVDLPISIFADEELLVRLFLNLITNSIKYRSAERHSEILINIINSTEKSVCIAVADNGIGIDKQHSEKIFDPMVRLKPEGNIEGSGLGLSICQRIVETHDGTIALDINYGPGARFLITLPTGRC